MKVAVLLNSKAGQLNHKLCEERAREIVDACRSHGIDADAKLCEAARLTETARRIARDGGVDAVIAAGGDGTVSAVAAGLVGSDVVLGVVPLGTLNHFSKDLGIRDLDGAIAAIASGNTARVDVGEVNGRVFINNSSIGLYPEIVVHREDEQRRNKRSKWSAMARAAFRILLRFPLLHVAIALTGKVFSARTPFVFVGNNEYETGVTTLGSRKRMDRGTLGVYTVRATSRLKMFWLVLRGMFSRGSPPDLEMHAVDKADIVTNKRKLKVALDGEVVRMAPPLHYRARPGALRVFAPSAALGTAGEAA
ncbi:MAG: diacylglycerol kinase family lipid kinase [Kofleriaceae bacterium]|nr:diacylglycerol kinase family lipid kinase [Kofleriaceae bacterium]